MKITLKHGDIDRLIHWVKDKTIQLQDTAPVFKIIGDVMREEITEEFEHNANNWQPISQAYRQEKVEQGYDPRVGIRTGGLQWASTGGAIISATETKLDWQVNINHVNRDGERVGDYAFRFNEIRKQFQYTQAYLKKLYTGIIDKWMKGIIND